jgi:hypothetical protein
MIHLYWHTDPPDTVQHAENEWHRVTDDEIRLWTPAELPDIVARAQANSSGVHERDRVRHVANIVRWHLLAEHGGMWADTDVTPLNAFPTCHPVGRLVDALRPWCVALGPQPTPFLCGGPAHHPLWNRMVAEALDDPAGSSPEASGGCLLKQVAEPDELHLISANLFTKHDARGRTLTLPPGGRFSDHAWATSRQRHQERGDG